MGSFVGHHGTAPFFLTSVSGDGRYLLDQYGNPFLINADTAWGLNGGMGTFGAVGLDLTDVNTYLADRESNGFNTVLFDVGGDPDQAGRSPWTTYPTLNSAYWSNVDSILQACQAHGISVFLGPMDAYSFDGPMGTAAQAQTYGAALGARYPQSSYPGIVWFFGNDYGGSGVGDPSFNDTDIDTLYEGFITGLHNAGDTRLYTFEYSGSQTLTSDSSTLSGQGPFVNLAYCYQTTYTGILRGYAYADGGGKHYPIVLGEAAYENSVVNSGTMPHTPLDLRKILLWSLTSGASGVFYGNDSLWQFTTGWQSQLDTAIVAMYKAMWALWGTLNWWTLIPDTGSSLVTSGRNSENTASTWSSSQTPATNDATDGNYVTAAYAADGFLAVIYNPNSSTNSSVVVSSSVLGSSPTITRYDPTNGASAAGPSFSGGTASLGNPGANAGGDNDWLYVITAT